MSNSRFDFRTEVKVDSFPFRLNYSTPVLFCGSCFAENIGGIMRSLKMPVLVNPNGVVFNPLSVAVVIRSILQGEIYTEKDLVHRNNLWFSFDHYTRFAADSPEKCLARINQANQQAHSFMSKTKLIAVTFGTARVYRLLTTGQIVANCHKIPAKEFSHFMLSVEEIVSEWIGLMEEILAIYPYMRFLFTVSPIRHWKDGAVGNQHSKATLLVAVHKIVEQFPEKAFYFPGYEIMMDDLRDYRFYDSDMLHPSQQAVDYIWHKFSEALIDKDALHIAEKVHKIQQALSHRPVNPKSDEFKKFVKQTIREIENIEEKFRFINFDEEKLHLKKHLH